MSNLFIKIVLVISLFSVVTAPSCKHKKKTITTSEAKDTGTDTLNLKCKLDYKNSKALIRYMKENEFKFDWLYVKSNVNTIFENEDKTFDAKVRLKKDSIMLITIELLTIDFAKVLITKDSIKMVDYHNKKYFKGDFNYINDLLNADLDFNVIQSIIVGNSAEFKDEEDKLKPVTDRQNCCYMLSTERKRRLKRIEKGTEDLKKALQIITLNSDNFKIVKNEFSEPENNRSFTVEYSNFKERDSVFAPYNVNIDIRAQKKMNIKIEYVRIEINKPQKFVFNIPSKYTPIEIQKK